MDTFAVSVCKGLANKRVVWKDCLLVGFWFGGFQALMPLLGYFLGATLEHHIAAWDHWIAFGLLGIIGLKMIRESFEEGEADASFSISAMFPLAVASSIDALAVGVTFAFLPSVNIWIAISLIGLITFFVSIFGLKVGGIFGRKQSVLAERLGGLILIGIGTKILIEHLFFLLKCPQTQILFRALRFFSENPVLFSEKALAGRSEVKKDQMISA